MSQLPVRYLEASDAVFLEKFTDIVRPTQDQIQIIEKNIGNPLPGVFREFISLAGFDYSYLFGGEGEVSNLEKIDYIYGEAFSMLEKYGVRLNKFIPFSTYARDQFAFIYLNEEDDPPVYFFETELAHRGDKYKPESSSWNLPKGVTKLFDSFSQMVHIRVNYLYRDRKYGDTL